MATFRAKARFARVLAYSVFSLFVSGCVMVESYYQPLPGQGKILRPSDTWNCAHDLQVPVGQRGDWIIYQRFEGWHNRLSVQIWLSIVEPAKKFELKSDEVAVVAGEREYGHRLTESVIRGSPHLRRVSRFEVDLGRDPILEFDLVLPEITIDGETFPSKTLLFRRKKGLIFYRSL